MDFMGRLLFIDGLRGAAALAVVFYHLGARTSAGWVTQYGYLGVAIFFVLSGFVISMSIGSRPISMSFAGRFAARRALRLDPPYWVSLAAAVMLAAVATRLGMGREMPSAGSVLTHMFYMQDLLEISPISPIYWTLCFEVQFYLFLLLLLALPQSLFIPTWGAVFLLSIMESAGIVDVAHSGLFLAHWYAFALGAMTYWVTVGRLPLWILVAGVISASLAATLKHADWFATAIATAGLILYAHRTGRMQTWLAGSIAQFFGRSSYSLYLFHPLIGWTAMSVALLRFNQWIALAVGLAASVISAWVAYLLIEKPSIALSRRVRMPERERAEVSLKNPVVAVETK